MLIYKFLNEKYGLEALRSRRLKVSRINDLNDPFELLAPNLSDPVFRGAFQKLKGQISKNIGLVCFSKMRTNPLLWSHYANKHRGICLGFLVQEENVQQVIYTSKHPSPEELFSENVSVKINAMRKFIATKYDHWRYENEWRMWDGLKHKDPKTGLYYCNFSDNLKLTKIVVGAESEVSRKEIEESIGDSGENIERFKTRAAFNSFKVVRNRDARMWK